MIGRGIFAGVALGLVVLASALVARSHIVVGSKTVRELAGEADLVVRARVVAAEGVAPLSSEAPAQERPVVVAEVTELLKGRFGAAGAEERVRFVQHGHGVASFEPGREHLLFLVDIARHRELAAVAEAGTADWVSLQEHDDAHPLDGPEAAVLLAATRDYVAAGRAATPAARETSMRAATMRLLASGDDALASSALRDLVAAPDAPLIRAEDRLALEAVVDAPATAIGVRVALLAQLESRRILDGTSRWLALLADDVPTADLVVTIRAAALDPRPQIRARLQALLSSDRDEVAAAAARALGRPGDASAVEPLVQALAHPSSRVRQAAVRGLGTTRTPAAVAALEQAGASHPDPATRRLAAAEAKKQAKAGSRSPAGERAEP